MTKSMFDLARSRLDTAYEVFDPPADVRETLAHPKEMLAATLRVRGDDGALKSFRAWRCRYNDVLGPTKGGLRFHPSVDEDELEALSLWMTIKCALAQLPFGGGKGGVQVDVHDLSNRELEALSRSFARVFSNTLGPDRDIAAPDMYTNGRVMAWMADEYSQIMDAHSPAVITGKPLSLGGSAGRVDATGRGAWKVLRTMEKRLDLKPKKTTVAFQGFGNAASSCARLLAGDGYRIVGAADSKAAVYDPDGIDPAALEEHKDATGSVRGFLLGKDGREMAPDDILTCDCDVLIPAALGNQIHEDNAGDIKAKVVLEIANGPVTPEADEILNDRGVAVLPDVLVNAGGVVVSYFEWVQNRTGAYWSEDEVTDKLEERLVAMTERVCETADGYDIDYRTAAYVAAIRRICGAISEFGTETFFES